MLLLLLRKKIGKKTTEKHERDGRAYEATDCARVVSRTNWSAARTFDR